MPQDLASKTIVITGATEGIGKAAALDFARRGARLVLVARSRSKGEATLAALREAGAPDPRLILADLSSMAETRRAAAEVAALCPRIDVLVNNAGAMFMAREITAEGLEKTFALNHMSYFLMSALLMDRLGQGSRVVSTASGAHRGSKLVLDNVAARPDGTAGWPAYADSKLCNIVFTRELHRRLAPRGAVASCYHPGFVASGFGLNNGGWVARVWGALSAVFGRSPEQGADTLIWLATAPEAARPDGGYFKDRRPARPRPRARDAELPGQLWALSEKIAGLS